MTDFNIRRPRFFADYRRGNLLLGVLFLFLLFNIGLWGLTRLWWGNSEDCPREISTPSEPINIVHSGVDNLPNWDRLLYGDDFLLTQVNADPSWNDLVLCVRWPLPNALPSAPINPDLAPWSQWLSAPSTVALLYAWQERLLTIQPRNPQNVPSWFRLTLHQSAIPSTPSTSPSWRYPINLWADLWLDKLAHRAPLGSANQTQESVPSTIHLDFTNEASAKALAEKFSAWQMNASPSMIPVQKISNPTPHPLQFWFYRAHLMDFQNQVGILPFWQGRFSCAY